MILGSILIGIMYRTLHDLFLHPGTGLGGLVGGVYLLTHVSNIENTASVIFGSLLLQFLTVLAFYLAVRFAEVGLGALNVRRARIRRGLPKLELSQPRILGQ